MPAPSSSIKQRSRSGPIAALTLLAMLYPLSYGPAWWLAVHGYCNISAKYYEPLFWLSDHVPHGGDALLWYRDCWGHWRGPFPPSGWVIE